MENEIITGDCLEVMKDWKDNSVHHVVTSPPYNIGAVAGMNERTHYTDYNDNLSEEEYYKWTKKVLDELLRVTEKNIFYNIALLSSNKRAFLQILGEYKNYIKDIIYWGKSNPPPAIQPGVMNTAVELIIAFSHQHPQNRMFYDVEWHGTVSNLIYGTSAHNEFYDIHKATFPLYIPAFCIRNFTLPGEIILDPFVGTGTTCIAAKLLGRKYIGIDISEQYCQLAKDRLRQDNFNFYE